MHIAFREAVPEDEAFLFALYASTRLEEFAIQGWGEVQMKALLHMQFEAQRRSYALQAPEAVHHIILLGDQPIGRMLVDGLSLLAPDPLLPGDRKAAVHLVDIAVLPAYRNQGIGTRLIQQLQSAAERSGIPVTLHAQANSPVVRLYQRLGFQITRQDAMYCEMIWTPEKT